MPQSMIDVIAKGTIAFPKNTPNDLIFKIEKTMKNNGSYDKAEHFIFENNDEGVIFFEMGGWNEIDYSILKRTRLSIIKKLQKLNIKKQGLRIFTHEYVRIHSDGFDTQED